MEFFHNVFASLDLTYLSFIVSLLLIFVCYYVSSRSRKSYKLLPGPFCFPIVGYCPFLLKKPYEVLTDLKKKYGDAYGITLGSNYTVVINENVLYREAFSKSEYTGRPEGTFHLSDDYTNLVEMSGDEWSHHNRFVLSTLKNLGVGKSSTEELISSQIETVIKSLDQKSGQDVNMKEELGLAIDNMIFMLVFGQIYEKDDPMYKVVDDAQKIQYLLDPTSLAQNSALLRPYLFAYNPELMKTMGSLKLMEKQANLEIEEHERIFDANVINNFVDAFLLKLRTSGGEKNFNKGTLLGNSLSLIIGGSHTTRSTIEWLLIELVQQPEIQEKVFKEIFEALGSEKQPNWEDHAKFPFTEAVILESSRKRTLAPLGIPRRILQDTKLNGFDIPKDTQIIGNIYAIHHDPKNFKEPEKFIPERFLNGNGQINQDKAKLLIPFSFGKRRCPGERLAVAEVFLIFVSIMQKFKFLPPKDGIRTDSSYSATYNPVCSIVRVLKR